MEIQAIRASTAFDSTSMAQAAQKNQETSSTESSAKPAGGARGKPPAGGGGAAPAGGAAQSTSSSESTSSSNKIYDKKDTNKDGTVSYSEELQYALKYPEETEDKDTEASQSTYDQQGKMQTNSSVTASRINIFA
jgi:hypothetical protein